MKHVLIVGQNSFIGSKLFTSYSHTHMVDMVPHSILDEVSFIKYDVVINCSINPLYRNSPYSEDIDMDLKVSRKFDGHYIMFSSRKVYGSNDQLYTYTEQSPINPTDHYGWNKAMTEQKIAQEKSSYTIFRASNIYGLEYQRNSIMGFLMTQLKDKGNIEIDISPYTQKDYIYLEDAINLIVKAVEKQSQGVYNLSSSEGQLFGNIANWLLEGYGSGSLLCKSKQVKDQFILDNTKLLDFLDIDYQFNNQQIITLLGKHLSNLINI